jgi:hypothetical protein
VADRHIPAKDWKKFEAWANRPANDIKGLKNLARWAPTWREWPRPARGAPSSGAWSILNATASTDRSGASLSGKHHSAIPHR